MSRPKWIRGQRAELARRSGISTAYLCDILSRRKRATPERAEIIEAQAIAMGLSLTRYDLMYPDKSVNPLIG